MSSKKERNLVIIGAIIVIGLAVGLPFLSKPSEKLLPNFALSQLAFSAVAFLIVFLALYFTIVQVRKSMAKPLIKVAFNEVGEQQAILIYKGDKLEADLPHPWLINKGNSVARYFQIDFIIPEKVGHPKVREYLLTNYVQFYKNNEEYILSYVNEGRYTLFVNRPYFDPNIIFSSAIDKKKVIESYKDSFTIRYKIYGDWAETQEGKLKIIINKQEVT